MIISVKSVFYLAIFFLLFPLSFLSFLHASELNQHPIDENLLVYVYRTGGLCPYGGCFGEQKIYKNGTYELSEGDGSKKEIHLSEENIKELNSLLASTDFVNLKTKPFHDICPTAYDGGRWIYYFYTKEDVIRIDSCETIIDWNNSLFSILNKFYAKTIDSE
jgi:hypothetical protein